MNDFTNVINTAKFWRIQYKCRMHKFVRQRATARISSKWQFFAYHRRKIDGEEGASKYIIRDVGSISEVSFVT